MSLGFLIRALRETYKAQERLQAVALQRSSIYSYVVHDIDKRYNVYTSIWCEIVYRFQSIYKLIEQFTSYLSDFKNV